MTIRYCVKCSNEAGTMTAGITGWSKFKIISKGKLERIYLCSACTGRLRGWLANR